MSLQLAAHGRKKDWQDILDIAERLRGFSLAASPVHLKVDSRIYPRFPSPESSVQKLLAATSQHISTAILDFFESKCVVLREQTLLEYKSTVSKMESISAETGIDDAEQQTGLSAGLEKWYEQAEAELISAIKASLGGGKKQAKDISPCGKMEKLHQAFDMNTSPNDKEREVLAEACGMTYKQVTTWFQNQRQRSKAGQKSVKSATSGKNESIARGEPERQLSADRETLIVPKKGAAVSKKRTQSKGHNDVAATSKYSSTHLSSQIDLHARTSASVSCRKDASNRQDIPADYNLSSSCTTVSLTHLSALAAPNSTETLPLTSQKPTRKIRKLPTARNKKETPSMNPARVPESVGATDLSTIPTADFTGSSRVPSLTRSVSSASGDSEACLTETSADGHWKSMGQPNGTKGHPEEQQQYQSPLTYRPIRRMREQKTPRALPALNTVDADRQQYALPSVSAMLPSGASPGPPTTFHLMTDAAGNQYIVPVSSAIPLAHPIYQQPRVIWQDENDRDLRTVSYAVPDSNRFEKIPKPAVSIQGGSRFSTPETSTEATPSPYQTPKMQVKHTASMTIAPAAAEYAPAQAERTISNTGSPADIPLPAPTYDELYSIDPRLEQQPQYQSQPQSVQAVLPEVSVDGVPFAFAEPESGSYMIDDETLRDMEALLGMDAGATGSFDAAVDVSPVSTQPAEYEEKNEGTYAQLTADNAREDLSPGSEGTVELIGLQGSSGLMHSSASQPVCAYDYATSSAPATATTGATADYGPLSGPSYAPPQTPTPAPSQFVDQEQGYPSTVYPQLLTSKMHPVSHSRGVSTSATPSSMVAGETAVPQYVYYSEPQYSQQPQYVYSHPQPQLQVQPEQPMQMQDCQPQQPQASGWNYEWEWDVLPFEGIEMGEMFTLDH